MTAPGRAAAAIALLLMAAAAPAAAGKGIELRISTGPASPRAGELVRVTLTGRATIPGLPPCRRMRVVAVAPGVPVGRALHALEGGRVSRRIGRWGAFRLASLRSTGRLRWTAVMRPPAAGTWTLVVPNVCALGFILPEGAARHRVRVAPAR